MMNERLSRYHTKTRLGLVALSFIAASLLSPNGSRAQEDPHSEIFINLNEVDASALTAMDAVLETMDTNDNGIPDLQAQTEPVLDDGRTVNDILATEGYRAYSLEEQADLAAVQQEMDQHMIPYEVSQHAQLQDSELSSEALQRDPYYEHQWYLFDIGADELRNATDEGRLSSISGATKPVRIAALDTNWIEHDDVHNPEDVITLNSDADSLHALHVLSLLLAYRDDNRGTEGMCPDECTVTLYDVAGENAEISYSAAAAALILINQNPHDIVIASFSGQVEPPQVFKEALTAYQQSGGIFIAPTGNQGKNYVAGYPAKLPGVLAVAATNRAREKAEFSNHFADHHMSEGLVAPGVFIITPTIHHDGSQGYVFGDGSSFNAPIVAGILAGMMHQGVSGSTAKEVALENAVDLGIPGPNVIFGQGMISPFRMLQQLDEDGLIRYIPHTLYIPMLSGN